MKDLRCLCGFHDWWNDGTIDYDVSGEAPDPTMLSSPANPEPTYKPKQRLVQRCARDLCWTVRFL